MIGYLKQGVVYSAIGKFGNVFVNLIVNAVLSRLLTPQEYGVVSIIQVFILFFQLLVEAGMGPAIIQNKGLSQNDNGILFNYSVLIAVALSISFGIFGYILANIYGNDIYINLSWLQAFAILFNGLNVVPTALLNKNKMFKNVNLNNIISNIISGSIGVIMALNGYGVYSLIGSSITLSLCMFLLNFKSSQLKLVNKWDKKVVSSIAEFSVNQFGFNFINYFSRNSDNILIGKFMGETALGNYSKAYQLLMMPNSVLLGVINPILQPVLSDFQENVVLVRKVYFKILRLLALIGIPLSVYLSVFSKEIILFLFGDQWGAAVFPFKILSTTVWIQMTLSSTGAIFQARNKTKELLTTGIYSAIILVGSICIGILSGDLKSFSVCLTVGFYFNYFVNFRRVMNLVLHSSILDMLKEFKNAAFIGLIELILLLISYPYISKLGSSFVVILISGAIFIFVFIILVMLLNEFKIINEGLTNLDSISEEKI